MTMHSGQRQLYKDGMSRSSPAISAGAAPQNHHRQVSRPGAMLPAQSAPLRCKGLVDLSAALQTLAYTVFSWLTVPLSKAENSSVTYHWSGRI